MLPALLISVTAHAAALTVLFSAWQRTPLEWPRPLTVTLEAPPLPTEPLPRRVVSRPPKPSSMHALPQPAQPISAPLEAISPVERPSVARVSAPATTDNAPAAAPAAVSPVAAGAGPGDAIEAPRFDVAYLNNPRPAYPPVARRLGLEGLVVLRVQVSVKGAPEQIMIAKSSGTAVLDEAALKAVRGWTFTPARRGVTPIERAVDVPIRFRLQD